MNTNARRSRPLILATMLLGVAALPAGTSMAGGAGGGLDPAFGTGGLVVTDLGGSDDSVRGVVVDAAGAITVVGEARANDQSLRSFALARYHADGTLDSDFGTGGLVHTAFGEFQGSGARAAAIGPDGRLVVVGFARHPEMYHDTFALARYEADGRLDRGFGDAGRVLTAIDRETGAGRNDIALAVAIDPLGRIVVAGETGGFLKDIAVARYLADGTLDPTFGRRGIVVTDVGGDDRANAVAITADGRIVVAGSGWRDGPDEDMVVVRYRDDGTVDDGVVGSGVTTVDFRGGADRAYGVALRPDGAIVVGGVAQLSGGCSPSTCERYGFGVAQLTADGRLDPGFGDGGLAQPDLLVSSGGYALGLLPGGSVALAGHIGNEDLGLLFVSPVGGPVLIDGGEALRIDVAGGPDRAFGIAVAPDGSVILAGDTQASDLSIDAALVRYRPSPSTHSAGVSTSIPAGALDRSSASSVISLPPVRAAVAR